MQNKTLQSFVKTLEVLIGLIEWIPPGTANENVICVDKLWLNFKSAFLKVADRHAPLIQKRVRGVVNCPWMTGQIKKDIRQRDYFLN